MSHEFTEDVADGSMCICGVPALTHHLVEESWQEPNIRAANEHLHRQLRLKDERIAELEGKNRWLWGEVQRLQDLALTSLEELNEQLNGEAA